MSNHNQLPDRPDVSDMNEAAARELIKGSIDICGDIVDFVYGGLVKFLEMDRELNARLNRNELPEGEVVDRYVLDEMLAMPSHLDDFQRSLALRFGLDEEGGGNTREGNDELFIYVPVPDEFDFDTDGVPKADTIYVEHKNVNDDHMRYAIGVHGFFAYSTHSDGQEVTEFDLLGDMHDQKRVDSGLPALAKIFENLVNMDIVPQQRIVVGQPGVTNL